MNKKDLPIYIVCAISVLLCFIFYMNTAIVAEKINTNCYNEFKAKCPQATWKGYEIKEEYPVFNLSNWVENENKADS